MEVASIYREHIRVVISFRKCHSTDGQTSRWSIRPSSPSIQAIRHRLWGWWRRLKKPISLCSFPGQMFGPLSITPSHPPLPPGFEWGKRVGGGGLEGVEGRGGHLVKVIKFAFNVTSAYKNNVLGKSLSVFSLY